MATNARSRIFAHSLILLLLLSACATAPTVDVLNSPERLKSSLKFGLDPNSTLPDGRSILVATIDLDQVDSFDRLLKAGAQPNRAGSEGRNAWYAALTSPNEHFILRLLETGDGSPVLLRPPPSNDLFITLSKKDLLRARFGFLLPLGIDVVSSGLYSANPVGSLIDADRLTDARFLLEKGVGAAGLSFAQLARVIQANDDPLLLLSIAEGAGVKDARGSDGETLLSIAVSSQNHQAIQLLLDIGIDPNDGPEHANPLALAILSGQSGVAIELLARGADPDLTVGDVTAIDLAEAVLDVEVLRYLESASPSSQHHATTKVRFVLATLNRNVSRTGEWNSGLSAAVKRYQADNGLPAHGHSSRSLLASLQRDLAPPFLRAAGRGDNSFLESALRYFPELVNVADATGWDALFHASYHARADAVERLLAAGAATSRRDTNGSNALLVCAVGPASVSAKRTTVRVLKEKGVNADQLNSEGMSANRLAQIRGGDLAAIFGQTTLSPAGSQKVYVAVMGRPVSGQEEHHCAGSFPREFVKNSWDKGLEIVDVGVMDRQWCVVMGKRQLSIAGNDRYNVVRATEAVKVAREPYQSRKADDATTLLDIALNEGGYSFVHWAVRNGGGWDGVNWSVPTVDLGTVIKRYWDDDSRITRVSAMGSGRWLVTAGDVAGFGSQSWSSGNLTHVLSKATEHAREGKHLTSLAFCRDTKTWVSVFSSGANLKDQVLVAKSTRAELEDEITKRRQQGWRVRFLREGRI